MTTYTKAVEHDRQRHQGKGGGFVERKLFKRGVQLRLESIQRSCVADMRRKGSSRQVVFGNILKEPLTKDFGTDSWDCEKFLITRSEGMRELINVEKRWKPCWKRTIETVESEWQACILLCLTGSQWRSNKRGVTWSFIILFFWKQDLQHWFSEGKVAVQMAKQQEQNYSSQGGLEWAMR